MSKYRLKKSILTWLLTLAVMMSVVGTNFIPAQATDSVDVVSGSDVGETLASESSGNSIGIGNASCFEYLGHFYASYEYCLDYITYTPSGASLYPRWSSVVHSSGKMFLYHYGSSDYDDKGYRDYRLGVFKDGSAVSAYYTSSTSRNCAAGIIEYTAYDVSDFSIIRHDTYGPVVEGTDMDCSKVIKKFPSVSTIRVYSENDYFWTGDVFESLEGAEMYYLTGDESGLIRLPGSPSPGDGDVSDGDVSDGDPSEGGSSGFDFGTLRNILEEVVGNPLKQIKNVAQSIAEHVSNMRDKLAEIGDYIKNQLPAKMRDAFSSFFESISSSLASIGDKISALGTSIVDGIGSKLEELFVPDLDNLEGNIATTRAKLGFIDDIQETGEYLFNFLKGLGSGSPPVITVNLGAATYRDLGTQTVTIDFSWYEPYKPMVDKLLAAFIYVGFIWNLFRHLPDIIQGHSMTISGASNVIDRFSTKGSSSVTEGDFSAYSSPKTWAGDLDAAHKQQSSWFK